MRGIVRRILLCCLTIVAAWCIRNMAYAIEESGRQVQVNITIPSEIRIVFRGDGSNEISDFFVKNESLLPISIESIVVSEFGDWKLVPGNQTIPVNTPNLAVKMGEYSLQAGENQVLFTIPEGGEQALPLSVTRGAWTESKAAEKVFSIEMRYTFPETNTYAIYSDDDQSFRFVSTAAELKEGEIYNGRVITKLYSGFEDTMYDYYVQPPWYSDGTNAKVKKVIVEQTVCPISTAYWFSSMRQCGNLDVEMIDMHRVQSALRMFEFAGADVTDSFAITGMENWDVSTVENMCKMFADCGMRARECELGNFANWQLPKSVDMGQMFTAVGMEATTIHIKGLENWDVSGVTGVAYMFDNVGRESKEVDLGDLSKWDVSHITDFTGMFRYMGYLAEKVYIGDIGKWDVSSATNMYSMFSFTGSENSDWRLDCSRWNVSKVVNHTGFKFGSEDNVIEPRWPN